MNFSQAFKMAFKSLKVNKLRTALTMLGVIIGVIAVSLLITVTQAARDTVVGQIKRESQVVMLMMTDDTLSTSDLEYVANDMRKNGAGEFDYAYLYSKTGSINKDALMIKAVDDGNAETNTISEKTIIQDIPQKSTIKVVSSNYFDVRNIELFGTALDKDSTLKCVIDQEFIDTYSSIFNGETNPEAYVGKKVILGGTSIKWEAKIAVPVSAGEETSAKAVAKQIYEYITDCAVPSEKEDVSLALYNMISLASDGGPIASYDDVTEAMFSGAKSIYTGFTTSYSKSNFKIYNESEMFIINNKGNDDAADDTYSLKIVLPVSFLFKVDGIANAIKMILAGNTELSYSFPTNLPDVTASATSGFVGGEEYEIAGVIKSESDLFSSSNFNYDNFISNDEDDENIKLMVEMMKRQPAGSIYVLDNTTNISLVKNINGDTPGVEAAHFKFTNELDVSDGTSKIQSAMIGLGYFPMVSFMTVSMQAVAGIVDDVMNIMSILLGVIAGISLIVGGIGIMNIMLVVVSERTKEIGIRKAIGAKRSSILIQFLIEALVITLFGGLIGIAISEVAALIIGSFMGITMLLPWWVILLSVGFCLVIGVGFGMYPAIKASKLHPIEALRRE